MFLHGHNDDALELCFGKQEKNRNFIRQIVKGPNVVSNDGIKGISRIVSSGKATPELVQDYTYLVYRNRLEILYGYKDSGSQTDQEEYLRIKDNYKDIIQQEDKFYDIILVDLDKGLEDKMVRQVLNISDVIVYNIEQKLDMINDFKKLKSESDILAKNNVLLNIGRMDAESKYTVKNISRYLGVKKDIIAIPYNTLYFEASSEENVSELFLRIRKLSVNDKNAIFSEQVKDVVEKIIYKLKEVQMKI